MVGVTGLEPAAFCSQSRRATNCATPRNITIIHEKYLFVNDKLQKKAEV